MTLTSLGFDLAKNHASKHTRKISLIQELDKDMFLSEPFYFESLDSLELQRVAKSPRLLAHQQEPAEFVWHRQKALPHFP